MQFLLPNYFNWKMVKCLSLSSREVEKNSSLTQKPTINKHPSPTKCTWKENSPRKNQPSATTTIDRPPRNKDKLVFQGTI